MKETLRLDRLAFFGLVAALALTGFAVYGYLRTANNLGGDVPWDETRDNVLRRMPDSEIRADYEICTAWIEILYPQAYQNRAEILSRALSRYPNSARLHLRAGTLPGDSPRVEFLRKAAKLDPDNSLPLYLLSAEALKRGSFEEALSLLRQGNKRRYYTTYALRHDDIPTSGLIEWGSVDIPGSGLADMVAGRHLRRVATGLSEYAGRVHEGGDTDSALRILSDIHRMAAAVMHSEESTLLNLMMADAISRIAHKCEKEILTAMGSDEGLSRIRQEEERLRYLRAGQKLYLNESMETLARTMLRFHAPVTAVLSLGLQMLLAVLSCLSFLLLAFGSWGSPSSEVHFEVTERAFPLRRLLRLYAYAFLPIGIAAAIVVYFSRPTHLTLYLAPIIAALVPGLLLHWRAAKMYKQAYREVTTESRTELPDKLWKSVPRHERREVARRLAGVHGGAVLFLFLFGLIISLGMKLSIGAFPWQYDYVMNRVESNEPKAVKALLAGEMKVPDEMIRELEKEEQERAKTGGG